MCSYGKFNRTIGPLTETVVWLAERPQRLGSDWGLGCKICAWFVRRSAGEGDGGPSGSLPQRGNASRCRLGTRFSRFEVRAEYLQAEHFKQHAESAAHRMAVVAWLNPDAPLRFAAQKTLADEQLFAGAVPQPIDWLRTWRAATTAQSWVAASRNLETEHYAHMLRPRSVEPRALQRMARIQAEVVRTAFREWIFEATSITLMFDDKYGYKLVLFMRRRADRAHPPDGERSPREPSMVLAMVLRQATHHAGMRRGLQQCGTRMSACWVLCVCSAPLACSRPLRAR